VDACTDRWEDPGRAYTVAVVFAGRRSYMSLLVPYLDSLVADCSLDEVHIWNFTRLGGRPGSGGDPIDARFVEDITASRGPAFKLMTVETMDNTKFSYQAATQKERNAKKFAIKTSYWAHAHAYYKTQGDFQPRWSGATPNNTVLLKIDDDIVYIDTGGFRDFVQHTLENPDMFVVHANIVNNPVTAYYQAHHSSKIAEELPALLDYPEDTCNYPNDTKNCFGDPLVHSPTLTAALHGLFQSDPGEFSWQPDGNDSSCLVFQPPNASIAGQGRFSINFFGARWAAWDKVERFVALYPAQDEVAITVEATLNGEVECIFTPFSVAHYAFSFQRLHGLKDDLSGYENLLVQEGGVRIPIPETS